MNEMLFRTSAASTSHLATLPLEFQNKTFISVFLSERPGSEPEPTRNRRVHHATEMSGAVWNQLWCLGSRSQRMLLFTAESKHVCLSNTPLENSAFMKMVIVFTRMLSRNRQSAEKKNQKTRSRGKSKVILCFQSKEKTLLDRGTEPHRQAADGQGQAAALKQAPCLSVRLNSVTLAPGSARTIQNRGCGEAAGASWRELAAFWWSGEPRKDGHVTFLLKDRCKKNTVSLRIDS